MSGKPAGSVVKRALFAAGAAFVFCFSLVPLYRIACESLFGIKLDGGAAQAASFAPDTSRWVTVEFDAGVNSQLPWSFRPKLPSMKVHPGVPAQAEYVARNNATMPIVGNAVPSVAPSSASQHFNKTECFCFTEQLLAAGEERAMPVRFVIDPELPDDVHTVTLSYTFYVNDKATAKLAAAP